ncbi:MAG: four helix bundle protein [Armatimonadota bacterium]
MSTFQRFEDIKAWQEARKLNKEIYAISEVGKFARDFSLKNQIRDASVSVMGNIAEGFERDGNGEFRQFCSNAKGSAGEVRSHLYSALDAGHISQAQFDPLAAQTIRITAMLAALIQYLNQCDIKGLKFKTPPKPQKPDPKVQNRNTNPRNRPTETNEP